MKWGNSTWKLFHTLAEKIKDNYFMEEKNNLIHFITLICNNLPCSMCKNHAVLYLKKNPMKKIKTKDDLKNYIFNFHNEVNKRKRIKIYNYKILNEYKKINFTNTINEWLNNFKLPNYLIARDFLIKHKNHKIRTELVNYLKKNYHKFLIN